MLLTRILKSARVGRPRDQRLSEDISSLLFGLQLKEEELFRISFSPNISSNLWVNCHVGVTVQLSQLIIKECHSSSRLMAAGPLWLAVCTVRDEYFPASPVPRCSTLSPLNPKSVKSQRESKQYGDFERWKLDSAGSAAQQQYVL